MLDNLLWHVSDTLGRVCSCAQICEIFKNTQAELQNTCVLLTHVFKV